MHRHAPHHMTNSSPSHTPSGGKEAAGGREGLAEQAQRRPQSAAVPHLLHAAHHRGRDQGDQPASRNVCLLWKHCANSLIHSRYQ